MRGIGLALALLTTTAAAEDQIIHLVAPEGAPSANATLFLPTDGLFTPEDDADVKGLLIGFMGDLFPLEHGIAELGIALNENSCGGTEIYTLVLEVHSEGVTLLEKEFASSCREVISWDDPKITIEQGKEAYVLVRLAEPETRDVDGVVLMPGLWGDYEPLLMQIGSNPAGSEIYLNGVRTNHVTPVGISAPYLEGDTERHYLIRQPGLVNCYGIVPLPKRRVTIHCDHRDVL